MLQMRFDLLNTNDLYIHIHEYQMPITADDVSPIGAKLVPSSNRIRD